MGDKFTNEYCEKEIKALNNFGTHKYQVILKALITRNNTISENELKIWELSQENSGMKQSIGNLENTIAELEATNAKLVEIVEKVAIREYPYMEDGTGFPVCIFCGMDYEIDHLELCVWVKSKNLLKEVRGES